MTRVGRPSSGEPTEIRVLHVDDDAEFVELAKTFLQRESDRLDVTTSTDAPASLDALSDGDFDCVVSDYDMPGQHGIEFLQSVRDTHPDIPFMLYTGKGSEEIASEAISAGVTDYLQKGTGTEQYTLLANRIENAVDQHRSREALAERNRRHETLVQNLPGMVYRCANEPNWPMEFVGGECETLTGYSAETVETDDGLWGTEIIHANDREFAWQTVQAAVADEQPFELSYKIQTRDGTVKEVWERGRGIYDSEGNLEALEGFITDVTDQKRYEQELEQSNARLEALFEDSPDMINLHDADGIIVDANNRICESLGYEHDELVGRTVWDVDVEATESGVQEMRRQLEQESRKRFETTFERADGSRFPVEVHISKLPLDDQQRFVAVSRDLSEREARRRELRRLTAEYETVFEHARDAIFLVDVERTDAGLEFVYRRRNDAHVAVTGMTEDIRGSTPEDVFETELSSELLRQYHDCVETATARTFEVELGAENDAATVSVRLSPVVVDDVVTQVVGISRVVNGEDAFE